MIKLLKISTKTFLETFSGLWLNLSSGWIGLLLISPGVFDISSSDEYIELLSKNLPLGILGFIFALICSEQSRRIRKRIKKV